MPPNLVVELHRREAEARLQVLTGRREVSEADVRQLVALTLSATEHLRYTWEYPRRALGEAGLEAGAFCEVCRSVLAALDMHQTLLGLIRHLAEDLLAREGIAVERLRELDEAESQVRAARRSVEDLLAFASRPRGEGVDWAKVQEAEEAFQRGEFTRLNPGAPTAAADGA
jgi:hypothetical protein